MIAKNVHGHGATNAMMIAGDKTVASDSAITTPIFTGPDSSGWMRVHLASFSVGKRIRWVARNAGRYRCGWSLASIDAVTHTWHDTTRCLHAFSVEGNVAASIPSIATNWMVLGTCT